MWCQVKKGSKYFSSGGGYVNSSGFCDTPTWVADPNKAWASSSESDAQNVAKQNGGAVVPLNI